MIEAYNQYYDVDIEEFIRTLANLFDIKLAGRKGNELYCHCPFHANGQERTASASFRLDGEKAGQFFCFGCHTKGTLSTILTKLFGTRRKAEHWLEQNYRSIEKEDKRVVQKILPEALELTQEFDLPESLLSNYTPYFESRGIPLDLVKKYKLMYSPARDAVIFPVYDDNNKIIFYQVRYLSSTSNLKWFIPKDAKPKIFGKLEVSKGPVYVCESCFNALTLVKFGYNAVATFGARFDDTRFELLEIPTLKFIIAYDGDRAGKISTKQLLKFFRENGRLAEYLEVDDGKDINDFAHLSKEDFDKKLESWKRR